jgi:hypothetical protein
MEDTPYKCKICGQTGAKFRRYRKVSGFVVISSTKYTQPVAVCEKHKRQAAIETCLRNFIFGWWGVHAFFWNIWSFVENLGFGGEDVTKSVEQNYEQAIINSKKLIDEQKLKQ